MRTTLLLALLAAAPAAARAAPVGPPGRALPAQRGQSGYWPSATCGGCHPRTLDQQLQSHHERSFTNAVFQAQYFEVVLPRASRDPALAAEARSCTACHAPIAFAAARGAASREQVADPSMSGVTCDVCHTIRGVDGPEPLNGNFVSSPTDLKLGPLRGADNAHHAFSPLQSRSELCGTCHEAKNQKGVRVKATYSEWLESPAAKMGVHCQDCHMTREGLARGAAAAAAEGLVRYTHRFPGAHSKSQAEGAVRLEITPGPAAGRRLAFEVAVDNTRSGHRLPTGSTDLRLLWLEVVARAGERVVPVPLAAAEGPGTAGRGAEDARVLGKDVPPGSRIYRAIFVDDAGKPTLQSWDARRVAFDNRLPAGGTVREAYALEVPADLRGPLTIQARLRYLAYPSSLAAALDLPPAAVVDVATATAGVTAP